MSKSPAFQLYAADFYMDTLGWPNETIGIYFRLLMAEWVNGPLENNHKMLQKIAQIGDKKWSKSWQILEKKFTQNGNGLIYNERLEETRQKQLNYRELQKISGRKGGLITQSGLKGSLKKPYKARLSKPSSENQALQSSSSSSYKKENIIKEKMLDFVMLTKEEYGKLIDRFGEVETKELIERLNNYIGSTGKIYKSHYFTILNFAKNQINTLSKTKPKLPGEVAPPRRLEILPTLSDAAIEENKRQVRNLLNTLGGKNVQG